MRLTIITLLLVLVSCTKEQPITQQQPQLKVDPIKEIPAYSIWHVTAVSYKDNFGNVVAVQTNSIVVLHDNLFYYYAPDHASAHTYTQFGPTFTIDGQTFLCLTQMDISITAQGEFIKIVMPPMNHHPSSACVSTLKGYRLT